jgi:prepilin-type processing-associated H-X9-DG protein
MIVFGFFVRLCLSGQLRANSKGLRVYIFGELQMKLIKIFYDKFSTVLALAMVFIALPATAAAQQGKIAFDTDRKGYNECKNGGWAIFNFPRTFINQGDCIDFVKDGSVLAVQQSSATTPMSRHTNGINVLFGDGSVRFSADSATGGPLGTIGSIGADGPVIPIKNIVLPNSPLEYDLVDASDPNAERKARTLFDAAYRMGRPVIFTCPSDPRGVSGKYPAVIFFINDGGDANVLEVKLRDVIVSNYQVSGGGGDAAAASYSLNFTKIEYRSLQ